MEQLVAVISQEEEELARTRGNALLCDQPIRRLFGVISSHQHTWMASVHRPWMKSEAFLRRHLPRTPREDGCFQSLDVWLPSERPSGKRLSTIAIAENRPSALPW